MSAHTFCAELVRSGSAEDRATTFPASKSSREARGARSSCPTWKLETFQWLDKSVSAKEEREGERIARIERHHSGPNEGRGGRCEGKNKVVCDPLACVCACLRANSSSTVPSRLDAH